MAQNTAAAAASDFVSPAVTPRAVVEAFVAQALKSDPVADGLKNDGEFNVLDPARVTVPTLLLFGERDINVPADEGAKFFVAGLRTPRQADRRLAGRRPRRPSRGHPRRLDRGRRRASSPGRVHDDRPLRPAA